ncbi:hypothetical protein BVG94_25325 (plasmid) [Serratia marcescens]|nr:hypothetical protein BVG94_25325 [Serratia marcescens]
MTEARQGAGVDLRVDCIVLKVRQDSRVINKSVFLASGINIEGQKELLGTWLAENEGANFWLNVLTVVASISVPLHSIAL